MRVSVIIPAHNAASFLAEAIESVLQQSAAPDEVLVVDDGSTDRSAEIAASYGGIVRVIAQAKQGPAKARNTGIAQANGSILAFLDADDIWLPAKLEKQLKALETKDLVFCRLEKFYSEDCPPELRTDQSDRQVKQDGYLPSAMICRADLFKKTGLLDENLASGEFIDWLDRARGLGFQEALLPDVLVKRRIHANNLTRKHDLAQHYLQVIRRKLDRNKQP